MIIVRRPAVSVVRRLWPLALLLGVATIGLLLGLPRQLRLTWLIEQQQTLRDAAAIHPVEAPILFMLAYAAMVACAIPGGVVLSTAAGLLFGIGFGTAYTLVGVTAGSCVLVVAARSALRHMIERNAGAMLARAVAALGRDGFNYLLAARLLPFAPFWLTNFAAALTRLQLSTFALATIIGITPITLVLTATGAGLADTLAAGGEPGVASLLRPQIVVPLILTALLSLAPVALRRFRAQPGRKSGTEK